MVSVLVDEAAPVGREQHGVRERPADVDSEGKSRHPKYSVQPRLTEMVRPAERTAEICVSAGSGRMVSTGPAMLMDPTKVWLASRIGADTAFTPGRTSEGATAQPRPRTAATSRSRASRSVMVFAV